LLGLCVHYDATAPVGTPGNEELATDYDRYVGETVAVSVVVAALVLVVFFREWRPDVDALAFEVRDGG
jgi:hypothetical protein